MNNFLTQQTLSHDFIFIENEDTIRQHLSHPRQESSKKYLASVKACIQHEGTHLMNNDTYVLFFATAAIPSAIEALSYVCKRKCKPIQNYWVKNLIKIPTGFAKGYCGTLAFFNYKRFEEQRADEGVLDDVGSLTGMKDYLLQYGKYFGPKPPFHRNFETHPTFQERIARCDERIQLIEEKKRTERWNEQIMNARQLAREHIKEKAETK